MTRPELRALRELVIKELDDMGGAPTSFNELIGESYAKELTKMTKAQAVQHLRTVDASKLRHAYMKLANLFLARNWNHPVLGELCLHFMKSPESSDRMMGAGEIGNWLEGTRDKQASRALALMTLDTEETGEVRMEAYLSLQQINNKITVTDRLRRSARATNAKDELLTFDWKFVNSFL